MSNQERGRSARRRVSRRKTTSQRAASGGPKRGYRKARKDWNRKGGPAPRFHLLRSMLPVIDKTPAGHHVVAFDPEERDAYGGQRRATRRSGRGRVVAQSRGRRFVREGEEDLDEVQSTSRRRAMRPTGMESGDKIQIEVGAVKALSTKYGIVRGATWMVVLSLLLWWVPVLGPATVGYVGGRKSGGPMRAAVAALIPIGFAFATLAALSNSFALVPQIASHLIVQAYQAFLGALPFDFPILAYIFTNLGAIMASGPDVFFTVLAFALVGGAVTQMRIAERSVPPITARVPKSRLVQGPAHAYASSDSTVEDLVDRLSTVLDRAEGRGRAGRSRATPAAAVADLGAPARGRRFGWLHRRSDMGPARYPQLQSRRDEAETFDRVGPASLSVVNAILSSTPPVAGERRAKAVKVPHIDLDVPESIAYAAPSRPQGAEGLTGAHNYRPSKYYHIYGSSVNPVARAKLEKRLRRVHTMHALRRAGRPVSHRADLDLDAVAAAEQASDTDPLKPRSLESDALVADLHYDAMEHLENASLEKLPRPAHKPTASEDELGGLIAHIGEGGEAVVDERAVEDVAFERGPVFDRKGRQRARIASEESPPEPPASHAPALPEKKHVPVPRVVREVIEDVEGRERASKTKVAQSADRADLSAEQKEKIARWLKHTLPPQDLDGAKHKAKFVPVPETHEHKPVQHAEPERVNEEAPAHEKKTERKEPEPAAKPAPRHHEAAPAPAFEITHGSTEVEAEASSSDGESQVVKQHKTASEILREIKAQKRAEQERAAQVEAARASKQAKQEADVIETMAREGIPMVALHAERTSDAPAPGAAPKRRRRSEDYEAVARDTDKLSGDLEMTLAPIREEAPPVHITEINELPVGQAHAAHHRADDSIPMVGEPESKVSVSEAVARVVEIAARGTAHDGGDSQVERTVGTSDIVLAGPSTDGQPATADEAFLNDHDRDKVAKRMQEGWNRM